jgi:nicotinate-nucleotide adenylyltransferase
MDTEIFEALKLRAELSVKRKRYEHSVRVTHTARELCKKFNKDEVKASLAGISHDMCKEYSAEKLLALASLDGEAIGSIERDKPSLLHGRAAAIVLQNEYRITDADILEAVKNHTFGKPDMGDIAKIIYIADKIEPGRKHVTEDYLNRLDAFSLDELLYYIVDENISYLEKKGERVSPISYELLSSLKGV